MNIWTAMDIVNEIGEELFKKHQALRSEHKRCRPLFTLLSYLSSAGYLAQDAHHQIESEISFEAQVSELIQLVVGANVTTVIPPINRRHTTSVPLLPTSCINTP